MLYRDAASGKDPQVEAAARVIAAANPDIVLLTGFDHDLRLAALDAFIARIAAQGTFYTTRFALSPNTGVPTDFDLDRDGHLRGAGDAQGFGFFRGNGGMAILSRLPIDASATRDFSAMLWRDLPGSRIDPSLTPDETAILRLSTAGHWDIPVTLHDGRILHLLAYHASPPVFGPPGDRNARRNHDETAFWTSLLNHDLPYDPPANPFVILGDPNLDPVDGQGRPDAITALLADPRITDPRPVGPGGRSAASQGGPNAAQHGDPAQDTADWPEVDAKTGAIGPGNLRVDFVLPSADLRVTSSGVWWPEPGTAEATLAETASRHRLVWVDVELP